MRRGIWRAHKDEIAAAYHARSSGRDSDTLRELGSLEEFITRVVAEPA